MTLNALFLILTLVAHHATAAQYDVSKTMSFTGKITRIDWANPHIHVYLSIKAEQREEIWNVEFPSPGAVVVAGLSKELLAPGTLIKVEAYPSRPSDKDVQPRRACAKAVTLADGTHLTFVVGI